MMTEIDDEIDSIDYDYIDNNNNTVSIVVSLTEMKIGTIV